MSGNFFIVVILILRFSLAEQCMLQVYRNISVCDSMWGYNAEAGHVDTSDVLNVSALIQYCRDPTRQNLGQCFNEAYGDCDPGWTDEQRPVYEELIALSSQSLEYLCSQVDIVDSSRVCLESVAGGITDCIQTSVSAFNSEFSHLARDPSFQSLPWDTNVGLLERMGRSREDCVLNLISSRCNSVIGKVFGNFFYGSSVYVYDSLNRRD